MREPITEFVNDTIHFVNTLQSYHWQTKSYSEHESFVEYHSKISALNDRLVETYQGREDDRIKFSSEYKPNVINYADTTDCIRVIKEYRKKIYYLASCIHEVHFDIHAILEEFLIETNNLLYHLSLK